MQNMDKSASPPAKNTKEGGSPVTMKRGRGRPKKIKSSMINSSDEVMANRPQKRLRIVVQNDKRMDDRLRKTMRLSYAEPIDDDFVGDDYSESGFESETDYEVRGSPTGPKKDGRGPGRPRKTEQLQVKSKQGRGRPRKIQPLLRAEDVGDRITSIEAELFGPKKHTDNNMPPQVKGKRGRPKKSKERKRGRPRKSIGSGSEDEKVLTVKPYTVDGEKRGRSRPKNPFKIRPEKVPGRGRGRPKNPFKPEKVPSERGRGRPKGSTKKPRGRPAQKHQTVNESSTSSEDFFDATDEVKAESSEESNSTSSSDDSATSHEEMNNTITESVSEKKTDKAGAANKGKGQNQKKYLEKKSSNQEKDSDKKAEKSGHKQGEKLNDIKESLPNPVGIESKKGQSLFV